MRSNTDAYLQHKPHLKPHVASAKLKYRGAPEFSTAFQLSYSDLLMRSSLLGRVLSGERVSALGDLHVARGIALVLDDEYKVEARQDGGLQVDVFVRALQVIVPAGHNMAGLAEPRKLMHTSY